MVLAQIFLNLAGGDCLEDLERLEADRGLRRSSSQRISRRSSTLTGNGR